MVPQPCRGVGISSRLLCHTGGMSQTAVLESLPPLVQPGPNLRREQVQRYSRHLIIPEVGVLGQRRLSNAKVLVIGAGGLGSPALLYLAAAGVGTLGVVDFDTVDESNLQRQIIHGQADLGRSKVVSAAESVARVNPLVRTVLHEQRLDRSNVLDIFAGYDLVLDGTDNFATRYLVNDACVLLGMPYVWGSIFRFQGQVSVFWAKYGPQYRDLYPVPPPPGSVPSCAEGGVLGVLCATIGAAMSTEAIKLITGIGRTLVGRLLVYDALEMSYRTVTVLPDPAADPVTELVDYDEFCGVLTPQAAAAADGHTLTAAELAARRRAGEDLYLVDVREPAEHEIVAIDGDVLIPKDEILSGAALSDLPQLRQIVLYCKTGARSAECLAALHGAGFGSALHLGGGILSWIDQVDPSLPQY